MSNFSVTAARGAISAAFGTTQSGQDIDIILKDVNFKSYTSVRDAHEKLAKLPPLIRFWDWLFHNSELATRGEAFATLTLFNYAEKNHEPLNCIEGSRTAAHVTVATGLSDTGQALLLQSVDPTAGQNELSDLLAQSDLKLMSAYVHQRQGDAHLSKGHSEQAVEAYRFAAQTFPDAVEHFVERGYVKPSDAVKLTGKAHEQLAKAARAADQPKVAIDAYEKAIAIYTTTNHQGRLEDAAWLYKDLAKTAIAAGELGQGVDAYRSAAQIHTKLRQHVNARDAYQSAAQACTTAGEHRLAAELTMLVAESSIRLGDAASFGLAFEDYEEAAERFEAAAKSFTAVGETKLALDANVKAADALVRVWQFKRAHELASSAADAYVQIGELGLAAGAYLEAARADYEAIEFAQKYENLPASTLNLWQTRATENCEKAAKFYAQIGQYELAARAYSKAADADYYEIANAADHAYIWSKDSTEVNLRQTRAAENYRKAADLYVQFNAFKLAAEAYIEAANADYKTLSEASSAASKGIYAWTTDRTEVALRQRRAADNFEKAAANFQRVDMFKEAEEADSKATECFGPAWVNPPAPELNLPL
ncbi:soluble NSF attachment family protein [Pandoraea sputorum]|uniref:hypothetical protein n=1 Tax=Pandoraea sputorum TaxID=93222 RepID=UPI0012517F7B|nr:hypothetical protein [Pandoraea sputorum]VVE59302.1 hypothetical protein PSP20601_05497 [Pandoraea sputorum]